MTLGGKVYDGVDAVFEQMLDNRSVGHIAPYKLVSRMA
jgi:hypothetical protein